MSTENLNVVLIPFDPMSMLHIERLQQQRLVCGWGADRADLWRRQQLLNQKVLYWIAIEPHPNSTQKQLIQSHIDVFSLEEEPLADTAPRSIPPQRNRNNAFIPIGHVSLDLVPSTNSPLINPAQQRLGGSNSYISPALRGHFFARQAMEAVKFLAVSAPYFARELVIEVPVRGFDAKFSLPEWYEMLGWKRVEGSTRCLIESDGTEIELMSFECDLRGYAARSGLVKAVL